MQPRDHYPLSLSKRVYTDVLLHFYHFFVLKGCGRVLFAVSCLLSVCGLLELKMTWVLIGAILTVYPGLDLNSQPPIWNRSLWFQIFSQNLKLIRTFWSSFSWQTVESLEILAVCVIPIKATKMTFRLWLIFGRSQVWGQPRGETPSGKEVITMSDKQGQ